MKDTELNEVDSYCLKKTSETLYDYYRVIIGNLYHVQQEIEIIVKEFPEYADDEALMILKENANSQIEYHDLARKAVSRLFTDKYFTDLKENNTDV